MIIIFKNVRRKKKAQITIKSRESAFIEKGMWSRGEDDCDNYMLFSFTSTVDSRNNFQ